MHSFESGPRRRRAAFSLIELLVVVLILAILAAIALPLYLRSVSDSETNACKGNMKTIANAVQANKVRSLMSGFWTGTVDSSAVGSGASLEDLHNVPLCPGDSSEYTVTAASPDGFHIACGNSRHQFSWENGGYLSTK